MTRAYSVLAPALSPNAILDLSIPVASGTSKNKELSEVCVVRHYDLKPHIRGEEEQAPLGAVKRVAVGQGAGDAGDDQIVSVALKISQIPAESRNRSRSPMIRKEYR